MKLSDIHAVMNPRVGTFKFCLSVCLPSTIDFEHRDQLLFNPYHYLELRRNTRRRL